MVFVAHGDLQSRWCVKLYCQLPRARPLEQYDQIVGRGVEQEVGSLLYALVRMTKPKVCVEIGTYVGDSGYWIGKALKDNGSGHLMTCDIDVLRIIPAIQRFIGLPVSVLNMSGEKVLSEAGVMDFVHIDSGNLEVRTAQVMSLDEKNIAPGGIVCWHDACVGHEKMYEQFAAAHDWPHLVIPSAFGLAVFQRPEG